MKVKELKEHLKYISDNAEIRLCANQTITVSVDSEGKFRVKRGSLTIKPYISKIINIIEADDDV